MALFKITLPDTVEADQEVTLSIDSNENVTLITQKVLNDITTGDLLIDGQPETITLTDDQEAAIVAALVPVLTPILAPPASN